MITNCKATIEHWQAQPLLSAALLTLVVVIVLGGPVACITHCWLLDAARHQPARSADHAAQHQHHHAPHSSAHHSIVCSQWEPVTEHGEEQLPSALTIAVLLPLLLLPQMLVSVFRQIQPVPLVASTVHPPPLRPPQPSFS